MREARNQAVKRRGISNPAWFLAACGISCGFETPVAQAHRNLRGHVATDSAIGSATGPAIGRLRALSTAAYLPTSSSPSTALLVRLRDSTSASDHLFRRDTESRFCRASRFTKKQGTGRSSVKRLTPRVPCLIAPLGFWDRPPRCNGDAVLNMHHTLGSPSQPFDFITFSMRMHVTRQNDFAPIDFNSNLTGL